MDLDELHAPWRNGEEQTRLLQVTDDLSLNILMPKLYWHYYDNLVENCYDMSHVVRLCWLDALDYDGPPIEGGDYEVFRRHLAEMILLYDDGLLAEEQGRDNDNLAHKADQWARR